MPQSPTTRERIVEFFESQSEVVLTPAEVAQVVDRSLDSVRTEMRGLYNAGVLRRKLLKGNLGVYWIGREEPMQVSAASRLPAIEARSTVIAA